MKNLLLTSILLHLLCSSLQLRAQTLEQWQLATVKITSLTGDGFEEVGTGVVIGYSNQTYWILTAAHVVATEGAPHEELKINFFDNPLVSFTGKVIQVDEDRDLALLLVEGAPGQKIEEPVTIHIKKFELRESVTAVGHPLSNDWNINISSQISEPSHARDVWRFGMTPTGFGAGSSGGPVINNDYKWLGLITEVNAIKASAVNIEEILRVLKLWKAETNLIHVPFEFLNKEDIPTYLFVDEADVPKIKKVPDGKIEYIYMELEEKGLEKKRDIARVYNFQSGELTKPEKKRIKEGKKLLKEDRTGALSSFFASEPITAEQFRDFLNAIRHRITFSVTENESTISLSIGIQKRYYKWVYVNLDSNLLGRILDFESGNIWDIDNNHSFHPYSYPGLEADVYKFRKNTNITEIEAGELFTLRVDAWQLMMEGAIWQNGLKAYCTWLNTIKAGGYDDWRPLTLLELIYVNQLEGQTIIWKEGDWYDSSNSYFDRVDGFKNLGFSNFHPRVGRGPSNIENW